MRKIALGVFFGVVIVGICSVCLFFRETRVYTAEDFGIAVIRSETDKDGDGTDDATDILIGARADAERKPRYDGAYVVGGYPADDVGVCTDVIWRAFAAAGYPLKDMVDADIRENGNEYPDAMPPDPNIDFRRVKNLHVFFSRHAKELTTELSDIAAWQPGDIVIFGADKHIGIISDKRNRKGIPFVIHNGGQEKREEDYFSYAALPVTAHFRWDQSDSSDNAGESVE